MYVVFSSPGQRPCEFLPLLGHLAYVHNPILYTHLNLLLGKHCGILSHTWLFLALMIAFQSCALQSGFQFKMADVTKIRNFFKLTITT